MSLRKRIRKRLKYKDSLSWQLGFFTGATTTAIMLTFSILVIKIWTL